MDLEKELKSLEKPAAVDFDNLNTAGDYPDFLDEGVHKVSITNLELKKSQNDNIYIRVEVANDEGAQRSNVMLATAQNIEIAIKMFAAIYIHNIDEEKRDKAKEWLKDNLVNASTLWAFVKEKMIAAECWISVEPVKNSKYPNVRLYSYEPKKLKSKAVKKMISESKTDIDLAGIPF